MLITVSYSLTKHRIFGIIENLPSDWYYLGCEDYQVASRLWDFFKRDDKKYQNAWYSGSINDLMKAEEIIEEFYKNLQDKGYIIKYEINVVNK